MSSDIIRKQDQRKICSQPARRQYDGVAGLALWSTGKLALISQKTKLAEAISYPLSRQDGPSRVIDDGHVEIDSNTVERQPD